MRVPRMKVCASEAKARILDEIRFICTLSVRNSKTVVRGMSRSCLFRLIGRFAIGTLCAKAFLLLLGFSPVGPVAESVASSGTGVPGGGAAWGFSVVQSI